jgi:ABC-2 type transport system permease protein
MAAARKEWIIFRRYPTWIVSFLVWPVMFPLAYTLTAKALNGPDDMALQVFDQLAGTTDYVGFILIGGLLWQWINWTLWSVGFQLRSEQMRGTLESNWMCPMARISIMLGASMTQLGLALLMLVFSGLEYRLLYGVDLVGDKPGLLALIILLLIPSIYGLGLAFASLVVRFKEANAMVFLVRGIFMVFCGMSYPLAVLPDWMARVAALLPLTYATRSFRAVVLAGATLADVLPDLRALAVFGAILPVVGYLAFSLIDRQSRRTGALGQY